MIIRPLYPAQKMRLLGVISVGICLVTWCMDWAGVVYACPYCRVQRTAIGALGLLMFLPRPGGFTLYVAFVFSSIGVVVAANQHFRGWAKVSAGCFDWGSTWYLHPTLLSGAALCILVAQMMALHRRYRQVQLS